MLENQMSIMHNGYGKADPQEQEGIMTTAIDAEKLQDAISRVVIFYSNIQKLRNLRA